MKFNFGAKEMCKVIDLHTHTIFSDGELLPSELARRAEQKGYKVIGITDHVDFSNVESVIFSITRVCEHINSSMKIRAVAGVEITHVSPVEIAPLVAKARQLGAKIVLVHGETIVEPVAEGTNREAIEAGVDILAHPGIIQEADAQLAAERKIYIEISGRKGHSFSNGHLTKMWYKYGFPLILNSDTHSPDDLIDDDFAKRLIISAGVCENDVKKVLDNSFRLFEKL